MNERIAQLVKAVRSGEIFPPVKKVEYDEFDLKLAAQAGFCRAYGAFFQCIEVFTGNSSL